ncbi:Short transient receptor putative channel 7, partial [Cichlidogyrus casuarinus]
AQSDQLNAASGNARIKEEIEHLRSLTNENQKALMSIVKAVAQMQDQVLLLNSNMEQWIIAQASGQQIRSVRIEERRPFNRSREESSGGVSQRKRSHDVTGVAAAPTSGLQGGSLAGQSQSPTESAPHHAPSRRGLNKRFGGNEKERDFVKRI